MKLPLALVVLLGAIVLVLLWAFDVRLGVPATTPGVESARSARPPQGTRASTAASPSPSSASTEPARPRPTRDLFRYAGAAPAPRAPQARASSAPALVPSAPAPPAASARLLGFVQRAGRLAAVVQVDGEIFVAEVGQPVGRFTLLALDEEAGARLRATSGEELQLVPEG